MFTSASRSRTLEALIARAEADAQVTGAVLLGSSATGDADRWSDLDVAFTVAGSTSAEIVAERWTAALTAEFGVVHHWDLPVGDDAFIRVLLLADGLELDLGFYPEGRLVRRGPTWRPLFGDFDDDADDAWTPAATGAAAVSHTIGLAWHHILHARTCIARDRRWQAEHWIAQARAHTIELACMRLGHPTAYAKGAHLLPAEVTDPLVPTLVRSLDAAELRRALAATAEAFDREVRRHDSALAGRLRPLLSDS